MSILEVIVTGYVLNITASVLTIVFIIGTSIISVYSNDKMEVLSRTTALKHLSYEIQELRKGIPWSKRYGMGDYAIIFPFMNIITPLKIAFNSIRFGIFDYLIYKSQKEIYRLEEYWELKSQENKRVQGDE